MTSSTPYTMLPEDLELLSALPDDHLEVRIGKGAIVLTKNAYAALGEPKRVGILFGPVSRMLAIRSTESGGRAVTNSPPSRHLIMCPPIIARLKLAPLPPRTTLRLNSQLIEGALLIGPLPEATS